MDRETSNPKSRPELLCETFLREPNDFRLTRDSSECAVFALFFGIFDQL
jgi:hypothetical protein